MGLKPIVTNARALRQHLAGHREWGCRRQVEHAFAFSSGDVNHHAGAARETTHLPVLREAVGESRAGASIAGKDDGAGEQGGAEAAALIGGLDTEGKLDDVPAAKRDVHTANDGEAVGEMGEDAVARWRQFADIGLDRRVIRGKIKPQSTIRRAQAEEMLAVESMLSCGQGANRMHAQLTGCCAAQSQASRVPTPRAGRPRPGAT